MTNPFRRGSTTTTPGQAPVDDLPRDSVRGLLAIALAWTVVVTALVAVHPTSAGGTASGGGRTSFSIVTVDGVAVERQDGGSYTVGRDSVLIELDITGTGEVECWNMDTDDYDWTAGSGGTVSLEVALDEGRNTIQCSTFSVIPQVRMLLVTYEPDPNATPTPTPRTTPSPPTAEPTPRHTQAATGGPDLFEITSIDGRHPGSASGGSFTVHQPTVRIDIDQRTVATVSCDNLDIGYYWETAPRVAAQYLEIDLRPGSNTITCEAGRAPTQTVRFEVVFEVDPTPSPDPAAVVITTVDGWGRNTIPDHGYTTWSKQIVVRGSAPDPAAVVCTGAACEGQTVHATGATTWAVQLELAEGRNRVEVHAADDPSNSDRITVELVP